MQSGYIKLFRKFLEWEWYDDMNVKILFIHILIKTNWEDKKYRGKIIKRGTFLTCLTKLAEETQLTVRQVRTALNKLKTTSEIAIESSSKGSIISVTNYDVYHGHGKQDDKPTTNQRQTNDKPMTTTKKLKELKELQEEYNIPLETWNDFLHHRNNKKAKVTKKVMQLIKSEADKAGFTIVQAIDEIILRNWTGFKAEWCNKKSILGDDL